MFELDVVIYASLHTICQMSANKRTAIDTFKALPLVIVNIIFGLKLILLYTWLINEHEQVFDVQRFM